ncbi:alpha-hydroxy acid oxidase [Leucobacter sp. wl10]|uniref:alpha-hydroxy acid oxidase n=1 Tax=Leucobacter sp. wl10 TaxID=2304677 RepID=UPI000E5ADCFA|nr:alpha-hydroxy acid oxidase [Leucobacter sp. wl10]RGE15851.1 hypothetical protein D1J51_17400 [Leucobacter sp. wl10]
MKRAARKRVPKMIFNFVEGGVLDEIGNNRSIDAMRSVQFRQRAFPNVSNMNLSSSILGKETRVPFFVSPMGMLGMVHPHADPGVAKAIAEAGGVFIHSAWSGVGLPEVVQAAPGQVWAQAQFWKDRSYTEQHLDQAESLGVNVLVLPGDCTVGEERERELYHGLNRLPPILTLPDLISCAMRPRWVAGYLLGGRRVTYGNYAPGGRPLKMSEMKPFMKNQKDRSVSWKDVRAIRERWKGKVVIKGVMCAEDARIALDLGADAVYVSTLGGRQFDRQPGTIEVLDEVVEAVGGRAEVYCDGGVYRGADVLNILSRGATAAGIGRAAAYALAAGGRPAVSQFLGTLTDELQTAMAFCGVQSISEIDASIRRSFSDAVS